VNVFAFSTPQASDWRWRIVDLQGQTVEESSTRFQTITAALAAGSERLQLRSELDRPHPARAPWRGRRR
jgi:hypothetical protein